MGNNLFHGSIEYKYGDNKIILRKNEYVRDKIQFIIITDILRLF